MKRYPPVLVALAWSAIACGWAAPAAATEASSTARVQDAPLETRTDALIARTDLAAYRGWLRFLRFEAETAARRFGAESPAAAAKRQRLGEWVDRIAADPGTLAKLRGVQEWAYESPADESGQPFKLHIPLDYDPAQPRPLFVMLHGYSGNHLEHSTGMRDHNGGFEVAVLGRARGGNYAGLALADVLHVLDYLAQHWRIDPDRVRLGGASMGGAATFRLGARFPQRFASGLITCGYVQQEPVGNLLTFPIYATHSADDWVVPIVQSRGPLAVLRRMGGEAVFDETNGLGHAAWNYTEGNARGSAWNADQVRRDSRAVRRVDFTALDAGATRAWWAEITEWGPEPQPARFLLTAGSANTLFAELTNVGRLQLRLDEAPFDRQRPLRVVLQGAVPREISAPLPDRLELDRDGVVTESEPAAPAPPRRHTPGGALQLYDGSPLVIVYGTNGDDATRAALRTAAEAASLSPNPAWFAHEGAAGTYDLVPHHHLLYGRLRTREDRAVTRAELTGSHLVLIGTAQENSIVAELESALPVQLKNGRIRCSDAVEFPAAGRMLGFTYRNPLAPQKLLFWVAAAQASAYAPNALVPQLAAGFHEPPVDATALFVGADLIVADAAQRSLVATRSLNSRWEWIGGRELSPLLPSSLANHDALAQAMALAVRRATGADFAFAGPVMLLGSPAIFPTVTRVSDLAAFYYGHGIELFELTGEEVLTAHARLRAAGESGGVPCRLVPEVQRVPIEPRRTYRVAVPALALGLYATRTQSAPTRQSPAAVTMSDALTRFLVSE